MRCLPILLTTLILSACGTVYHSPRVTEGVGIVVRDMTADAVAQANSLPYQPRALPSVFRATAGVGQAVSGGSPLPQPAQATPPVARLVETRIPPSAPDLPYVIGTGDVLALAAPTSGSTLEDLSGFLASQTDRQGYAVQDDGSINIPKIGRVPLAGMTVADAEAALFQRFLESGVEPTFSLEISRFNARKVSVAGAVAAPTVVPVTQTPLYLSEALAQAGGIAMTDPDTGVLRIYREGRLFEIPLDTLRGRADLQRLRLQDGDSLYVDASSDMAQAEAYFEQQITLAQTRDEARETDVLALRTQVALRREELAEARANFEKRLSMGAVARDYVYLMGEVARQTRFPLPFEQQATLADALFDTGGGVPLATGDVSQIYVLRGDPQGRVTAWRLDGRNAVNFIMAARFQLRPDDIIFVAEQPITRWGRVVQQLSPGLLSAGASWRAQLVSEPLPGG